MNVNQDLSRIILERESLIIKDFESNEPRIDELAEDILKLILENSDQLSFEFIFESLTKLGYAMNLIYDDNGRFAISADVFQSISDGDSVITTFVSNDQWSDNIRGALDIYLNNLV